MTGNRRANTAVYVAAIIGWFWHAAWNAWPAWQSVTFLVGMAVLSVLAGWAGHPRCSGEA